MLGSRHPHQPQGGLGGGLQIRRVVEARTNTQQQTACSERSLNLAALIAKRLPGGARAAFRHAPRIDVGSSTPQGS